jgi:RND family efflux transporter MFP subunit
MEDQLARARAKLDEAEAAAGEAAARIERAKAERELATVTAERYRNLRQEGGITQQQLDEAEAKLVLAEAAVKDAEAAAASARARIATEGAAVRELETLVRYAEVRAPFDGVVTDRRIDPGGFVPPASSSANAPLLTVVRVDTVRVWIDVSEQDVPFVEVGKEAAIEVPALPGRKFEAKVSRFATALDPATRTMRTAIDVRNEGVALRPGMYARVTLDLETRKEALTVPAEALIIRKHERYVFCIDGGRAARRKVVTGIDDGLRVEVSEGLAGGELIVTAGKSALTEGAEVEPVPAEGGSH